MSVLPTPSTITASQIRYCFSLYPTVIEKHYAAKIKDAKKRTEAIERDSWRYDDLPSSLGSERMSLETLERLVQWKITHGHSRPFLPAMIRKNDPERVLSTTGGAASLLADLAKSKDRNQDHALDVVFKALDVVGTLSGVGPATASLILSAYASKDVPFFEDEMFHWLCADVERGKLKYDKKEYSELSKKLWELRERLDWEVSAVDVEKATFVLGHWELVDQPGRQSMPGNDEDGDAAITRNEEKSKGVAKSAVKSKLSNQQSKKGVKEESGKAKAKSKSLVKQGAKRGTPKPDTESAPHEGDDTGTRRSKRVKK